MTLAQVAAELERQAGSLARRVVGLVWERVPGYGPPRLAPEDLAEAVAPSLDAVIARLGGKAAHPSATELVRRLGVSRALQGVPLDAIVLSYRCAERVLTDAFVSAASGLDVEVLGEGLRRLAAGFDELAAISIAGYRETQAEVTARYDRLAGDLVTGLVRGDLRPGQVSQAAEFLGWDVEASAQGIALRLGEASRLADVVDLQRDILAVLRPGRRGRILAGHVGGHDVVLIPGGIEPPDETALSAVLSAHPSVSPLITIGEPAASLLASGASCRQALAAMRVAPSADDGPRVLRYDAVLLDVLANADRDAGSALVHRYLTPLSGRPQLIETIRSFAACDLSIRRAAEELIVHPNTVVYRLERIRELTGHDPRSAMELCAFLAATRVRPITDAS